MTDKQAVIVIDIGHSTTKLVLIEAYGELRYRRILATGWPEATASFFTDRIVFEEACL